MKKAKVNKDAPRNATPVDTYIGARMRERRLALNMSQHELGRALGVSFQQIQKYERGRNRVSAARLFDICKVFNVSLSSMFERDPERRDESRRPPKHEKPGRKAGLIASIRSKGMQ
jgi:transcriptional regulator with XRE-family HTH domain